MTANNDYILARWRDASTDPPPEKAGECGVYTIKSMDGDMYVYTRCGCHGAPTWLGRHRIRSIEPGDQWLDITDRPGVAREAVQAAVDGIESRRCAIPGQSYDPHRQGVESGLAQGLRELRNHTGVTPSEVTDG